MTPDALTKLQVLLKELFQIEAARDLDFGIYRIMNEKRGEVEEFIDSRLPEVVDDALGSGAAARSAERIEDRRKVSERVRESFGESAFTPSGELADAFHDTPLGKEYLACPPKSEADEPDDLRASIFNHLFTFFSRYYDNGDFISRRRYSKRERYAIPYNGEEVHLHWANADQYYVKSGSFFLDYAFESGGVKVRFEVVSANTEHDNVKEGERSFVPLTEDASYDTEAKTVTVPFEWRPLSADEKKEFGKNGDGVPARSERDILSKFEGVMEVGKALSDPRPKKNGDSNGKPVSVLAHHLSRYARKNSSDFFVHKDLGGFLERELDFYIKNEVLDVEDLLDADGGDALVVARMETVRAMRGISRSIIEFLAQIEAFQKRLFEKKKFVVSSHFCMTLDRVPEKFHEEISNNDAQYEEWEDLFATSEAPETLESVADPRSVEWLAANPHLVLDTKHFDRDFEDRLLSTIEDLDDATDGLLINSDNFQALNLIGDDAIKSTPVGLKDSERVFVEKLRNYCRAETNGDGKVFLLRNLSRGKGIGFFKTAGFYPDFIVWVKRGGRQRIVFVEPHGMRNDDAPDHNDKIRLHRDLEEISARISKEPGHESVELDSFMVSATPFENLKTQWNGTWDRGRFAEIHILFEDDLEERMPLILHGDAPEIIPAP